ncbi:MAG: ABC transporter substrate-binding protein [Acidobacteria bacterium]|nr:ABC transporter substrate-binding protein [Acidobacteriota bacterium]
MRRIAFLVALTLAAAGHVAFPGAKNDGRPAWHVVMSRPTSILAGGDDPLFAGRRGGGFFFGCGLFRLDGRGVPRPDLARRARAREGGLVWDVTLRPGLRLADGSALNAVGFVRLWTRQIPARRETRWLTAPMALPPVALDVATVRFRLREPRPGFLRRLSHPWLFLMDPHAEAGDPSSLGPFRLVRSESPDASIVRLVSRADHHHGLDLPGDFFFREDGAGASETTYCADDQVQAWLVFSAAMEPSTSLRRRVAAGLHRLVRGDGPLDPGRDKPGEETVLTLLLARDDSQIMRLADQMQAALVDANIRLRLEVVAAAELERRLRAGLYTAALVRMPAAVGTALDMEARLVATGLWGFDVQARLAPFLRLPPRRQKGQRYLDLIQPPGAAAMQLPVQPLRVCLRLPAGAPAEKILPWLTPVPVGAFRKQAAGATP